MSDTIPDMEEILAQMREKFLETAVEKIDRLNEILVLFRNSDPTNSDLNEEFRREIHSLKGMGGTFQMILVTKLCHAFENYIEDITDYSEDLIETSQLYIDRISKLIESDEASKEELLSKWLDGLPQKGETLKTQSKCHSECVVIASENKSNLETIKRSFEENGYSVLSANDPFETFKLTVENLAPIVVVDQHFKKMSGAELLRSLEAQNAFSQTKFAMICPDRKEALKEKLVGVHLLSEKNIDVDILNFIALTITA